MTQSLTLAFILLSIPSFAQEKLAIINDKDGFVNIRGDQSINSNIIGKITEGELFHYKVTNTEWFFVSKPTLRNPLTGFVHRSRIQALNDLGKDEKRKLLADIFGSELSFIKSRSFGDEYNSHHELKFDFVLPFAARFIIENKDEGLMQLFIETIKLNIGSADEHPADVLGYIFDKSPEWTILQLKTVGLDKFLIESLEFGFSNLTFNSTNTPRIEELKQRIQELKK